MRSIGITGLCMDAARPRSSAIYIDKSHNFVEPSVQMVISVIHFNVLQAAIRVARVER